MAAYSTAGINHLFRGDLAISAPPSGVISIVDHSTFSNTEPLAGLSGFREARVQIRNVTTPLPGQSVPESMTNGTLFARFRFGRNICYEDDLSGQSPLANALTCRVFGDEFVVSEPITNASISGQDQEFTFVFDHGQLPINATDVQLQIIYRGTLGTEVDAIVVDSLDVSEPSFFTYFNLLDHIAINNVVHTRAAVDGDVNLLASVQPQSCVNYSLSPPRLKPECFPPLAHTEAFTFGSTPLPEVQVSDLPVRRFARIAMLSVGQPITNGLGPPILAHGTGQCDQFEHTINSALYTLGTDPQSGLPALFASPNAIIFRGMPVTDFSGCVWDGGGNPTDISRENVTLPAEGPTFPVQVTTQ